MVARPPRWAPWPRLRLRLPPRTRTRTEAGRDPVRRVAAPYDIHCNQPALDAMLGGRGGAGRPAGRRTGTVCHGTASIATAPSKLRHKSPHFRGTKRVAAWRTPRLGVVVNSRFRKGAKSK